MNKFLVSKTPPSQLAPRFSPQIFLSQCPSLLRKNQTFLNTLPPKKCSYTFKIQTLCTAAHSDSLSYGGWDDPQLGDDSFLAGEPTYQLQKFLNLLGIDDKRYIFMYLLGFFCALGVARTRVSSIVVIPACVIVFAVGFTIGYVNGGYLSSNGVEKRPKDDIFRNYDLKFRNLWDMIDRVISENVNLKDNVKKNIESNRVTLADLEGAVKISESVSISALDAKSLVESLMGSILIENQDLEKNINKKSSKKRNEAENVFDLSRYLTGLFKEKPALSSASTTKNVTERETKNEEGDGEQTNILAPGVKEQVPDTMLNQAGDDRGGRLLGDMPKNLRIDSGRASKGAKSDSMSMAEVDGVSEQVLSNTEYHYRNKRFLYVNNEEGYLKMNYPNAVQQWDLGDSLLDSMDFNVNLKHRRVEETIRQEQRISDFKRSYMQFDNVEDEETETSRSSFLQNGAALQEEDSSLGNQESANDIGYDASPPLVVSEDMEFSKYLTEANTLLKEAKHVLRQQGDDRNVEEVLYKSARLLTKAVEIRPMSLLAVGQLGNAYLLHGELKLRISRELRAILTGKEYVPFDKWESRDQDKFARKEKLTSALGNTCEECEDLLIKAGRNYRLALSIDGNDMRALYNWGLALSFRGQLIADIGPGAARDADKVFLAAIDKFSAMLSRSNTYAPDALFRWGATLQYRSRLRPRNTKEKVKLLQQARRLYEDALDMDSKNVQVQEALSSCVSELKFWYN